VRLRGPVFIRRAAPFREKLLNIHRAAPSEMRRTLGEVASRNPCP
jgi:hypothetical protein